MKTTGDAMKRSVPERLAACSSAEAARLMGCPVRTVQAMVDRGELPGWKTPGGHRRIARDAVDAWLARRAVGGDAPPAPPPRVLLIEDSMHVQRMVSLLMRQNAPDAELRVTPDVDAGLALCAQLHPQAVLVDLDRPADAAPRVEVLRHDPRLGNARLVLLVAPGDAREAGTSAPPRVHKDRLPEELPAVLADCLA